MPKPRNPENKGLPQRWRFIHGAYYYAVPKEFKKSWGDKSLFRLGKTLPDAYRTWAERVEIIQSAKDISALLDRYALEVIPYKQPKTRTNNIRELSKIRAVFGEMALSDIRPQDIYGYMSKRTAKRSAKMEVNLLSHAFTKAVEWGYLDRHPFKGEVRIKETISKDKRYVEDWEIEAAIALKPRRDKDWITRMMSAYVRLKLVTGLRMTDMLQLRPKDMQEDGLHVTPSKTQNSTGKRMIIKSSPTLIADFQAALDARPFDISPWVFCNQRGRSYFNPEKGEASGFNSLWQRWMKRVLNETAVELKFSERDIRAKTSSDIVLLGDASALLGHADSRVTSKHYRRKPEMVNPLK